MPQKKHTHNHPYNKQIGKGWAIQFDNWGAFKSPLMGWSSASHDSLHSREQNALNLRFGQLKDAVAFAEAQGWGLDIQYPTNWRWHTKKNYADNFAWKGPAPAVESYD